MPPGAVGQLPERSRVPVLVNRRLSGSIQAQGRGGDAAGRGGSPWIYGAGFCVSPSGPGRFQQHSHNGPRWTGQDGTASGPLPFCTAGGPIRRMGQAYFLNEARGSELRG